MTRLQDYKLTFLGICVLQWLVFWLVILTKNETNQYLLLVVMVILLGIGIFVCQVGNELIEQERKSNECR